MLTLSLQQMFGANVYQDSNSLVIKKSDFSNLVASGDNKAESLLIAILLKVFNSSEIYLTDTNDKRLNDAANNFISNKYKISDFTSFTYWKRYYFKQNNQNYLADTFIVQLHEPYIDGD